MLAFLQFLSLFIQVYFWSPFEGRGRNLLENMVNEGMSSGIWQLLLSRDSRIA
jgi:hypothetical protein